MIPVRPLLNRLLFKKILYCGQKNVLIDRQGRVEDIPEDRLRRAGIVVLSKRYYFETSTSFPFLKGSEIRSAIAMDIPSYAPFETDRFFFRKIAQKDDRVTVNLWFVDPAMENVLRSLSPRLILPESALFPYLKEGAQQIYVIDKGGWNLMVYAGADGRVMSMPGGDGPEDISSFKRTIGASARNCEVVSVSGMDAYLPLLYRTLEGMPFQRMLPFVNRTPASLSAFRKTLKWGLGTSATLVFLFLSLSFLLPYMAASRLEMEEKALSRNLREVLKKQDDLVYHQIRQEKLTRTINQYPYKIQLLQLLNDLLPEQTLIQQMTISGNMVEIQGLTPKGSELISRLATGKGIQNARFISQIKQDKKTGMELFGVSFVYQGGQSPP